MALWCFCLTAISEPCGRRLSGDEAGSKGALASKRRCVTSIDRADTASVKAFRIHCREYQRPQSFPAQTVSDAIGTSSNTRSTIRQRNRSMSSRRNATYTNTRCRLISSRSTSVARFRLDQSETAVQLRAECSPNAVELQSICSPRAAAWRSTRRIQGAYRSLSSVAPIRAGTLNALGSRPSLSFEAVHH